jgi:GAF domain-containing protein
VQLSAPSGSIAGITTLGSQDLDSYVANIHQSLDFREAAGHVANETRRVLDCDRVTVFKKVGNKFQVTAISGQPSVNRRSNTVKLLQKLADVVLATGRNFWFPLGTDSDIPPQIETTSRSP